MASASDVANAALRLVGSKPVVNLETDATPKTEIINDLYPDLRDDLLRSHPWNFATKRAKLARSATAPAYEFDYAYPLPGDWLRTVSVHDNDGGYSTILYRMEVVNGQRCIIASADNIYIRYVYQVTDPNLMAADFRRALEVGLARDLAIPIASSNTLQDQLSKQFMKTIARARSADAMGAFPELRPRGSWANARGGFRSDTFLND